uniref:CCHC-type domain-containing protein n=1 Tax=Oncorhynchus mykiss TaxID=8022 RepID=A0A8K9WZG7_ONCMY
MEEAYDITFYTESKSDGVMEKVKEAKGERPLSFFNIVCLARKNFRTINIHMYNPHVTVMAVAAFLGRYCEVTSGARYVKDSLGFWNGRRQFQVLLREDPGGFEGFLHPPAVFTIGADRGMLFYARQPPFCRKCREYGHGTASCGLVKCRICMSEEHEAKNCTAPKECHGCGSKQHLFRECPARQQTYAAASSGTPGPPIPNPLPASWGSQEGGMRGGKVGGTSEAAGPASNFDEDLYPPDRVNT